MVNSRPQPSLSRASSILPVADGGSAEWRSVDQSDPDSKVAHLDRLAEHQRKGRWEALELLQVRAGDSVLDVGCGAGDMMIDLAREIAPGVRAIGVDASAAMITTAKQRAADAGVEVDFRVGDAESLEFGDASIDAVNCTRVLMHLARPAQAIKEIVRVLKPGRRMVLSEPDWDAVCLDGADPQITRQIIRAHADRHATPTMGRQLRRLALDAGVDIVSFEASFSVSPNLALLNPGWRFREVLRALVTAGAVSQAGADRWWTDLEDADRTERFFAAIATFRLVAQRPTP